MRQNTNTEAVGNVPKNSGKSRYASKKNYFARNKDGAISNKNRDKGLARRKRRADYWASPAGVARKEAKMNTKAKIEKRAKAVLARDARRRARRDAEVNASQSVRSTVS